MTRTPPLGALLSALLLFDPRAFLLPGGRLRGPRAPIGGASALGDGTCRGGALSRPPTSPRASHGAFEQHVEDGYGQRFDEREDASRWRRASV